MKHTRNKTQPSLPKPSQTSRENFQTTNIKALLARTTTAITSASDPEGSIPAHQPDNAAAFGSSGPATIIISRITLIISRGRMLVVYNNPGILRTGKFDVCARKARASERILCVTVAFGGNVVWCFVFVVVLMCRIVSLSLRNVMGGFRCSDGVVIWCSVWVFSFWIFIVCVVASGGWLIWGTDYRHGKIALFSGKLGIYHDIICKRPFLKHFALQIKRAPLPKIARTTQSESTRHINCRIGCQLQKLSKKKKKYIYTLHFRSEYLIE